MITNNQMIIDENISDDNFKTSFNINYLSQHMGICDKKNYKII